MVQDEFKPLETLSAHKRAMTKRAAMALRIECDGSNPNDAQQCESARLSPSPIFREFCSFPKAWQIELIKVYNIII